MTLRVLIADDHKIVREGLRSLLENEPEITVVGEAEDGRSAVLEAARLKPDIVILDITMAGLNGIEATRKIVKQTPRAGVVALSMHSDKRFVVSMLQAGASAYVLKESAFEELATAVRTVGAGRKYLTPAIAGGIIEQVVENVPPGGASLLTPRECEVLQLLAEGQRTKRIASSLHVSVTTIETHRKQIMDKLDLHSIAELTKYAIREGLTQLEP